VRFNGVRRASRLRDLLLADVHANVFEQHLDDRGPAVIFGDLLDPSQAAKFLWVVWGI
jgi:hypothetical protein